jgi:hypothetical protein
MIVVFLDRWRDAMRLGIGFWLALIAGVTGAAIVGLVLFMLFGWAWSTLGFFGAFAAFALFAIVSAFLYDRREQRRRLAA